MSSNLVLAAFVLAICIPATASGQVLYGSVVGNVNDSSGSAVPDATVTIVEVSTGFTRQATTNPLGQFQFPSVPGGVFKITVSKTGFSTFAREDLSVSPNSVSRIDVALEVGAITETIRVDACSSAPRPSIRPTHRTSATREPTFRTSS